MEGLEEKLQNILSDPNSMAQIMSMAQSLGLSPQNEQRPPSQPAEENFGLLQAAMGQQSDGGGGGKMPDLQFLQSMMGVMQQAQRSDGKQEALLCALKPFLRPERREGIDRAMQLAKLSQLAGIALKNGGLMGSKGG